jgi:Helix-turn-helix domain
MAEARFEHGDPRLRELFEEFDGRLVSPGGAAALLGLSRKTIYTLGQRGKLRVFKSANEPDRKKEGDGYSWVYIPYEDVQAYARQVGRPVPK